MSTPFPPPQPPVAPAPPPSGFAGTGPGRVREPRSLPAGAGTSWWSEAWRIFTAAPGTWIGITLVFLLINGVLTFVPVLGGIASQVLGPVFAGGAMLGCHALARGEPLKLSHLFAGFSSPQFGSLALLGALMFGVWLVVIVVIGLVMVATLGVSGVAALMTGDATRMGLAAAATLGVAGVLAALIGVIVALVVSMLYWFAPQLVVLQGQPPVDAMKASWRACMANIGPFVLFGLVGVGLAIAASIPFGLGWLVLAPMTAGSFYASWRQVFSD